MKRARLHAATLGGTPDEVELAFYEALHNADIAQLMACWAEEDEIVCILPDGVRLIGSGNIRRAFEGLFSKAGVLAFAEQVHKVVALASVVHHMVERQDVRSSEGLRSTWSNATNVYHKTPQGWRLVARHLSTADAQASTAPVASPPVLH